MIKLTQNFRLIEFQAPLVPESAPAEIERTKLPRVANALQWIRDLSGSAGIVTSYYRSPERNDRVSETGTDGPHTRGVSADARFPFISKFELMKRIRDNWDRRPEDLAQVIVYEDTNHIHVAIEGGGGTPGILVASSSRPRTYAFLTSRKLASLSKVPPAVTVALFAVVLLSSAVFFFPSISQIA